MTRPAPAGSVHHRLRRSAPVCSLRDVATFLFPPDDQWPRVVLPAWPPYEAAPCPGLLVCERGTRGVGASRVLSADADSVIVEPLGGGRAARTISRRKAELMRGRHVRRAVLLCGETETFRRLARSQLLPSDRVLEIGCSYGEATSLLAKRAKEVLAVDVSGDALERARGRWAGLGNVRFEKVDALRSSARLLEAAAEMDANVVFVDVNGNRASAAVAPLLAEIDECLAPAVVVVKNRELHAAAQAHTRASPEGGGPPRSLAAAGTEALLADTFWPSVLSPAAERRGPERRGTMRDGRRYAALWPGHARASEGEWPRFLFLFRGVAGSFRLAELRSVALTLGVDAERLWSEPATIEPSSALVSPSVRAGRVGANERVGTDERAARIARAGGDVAPISYEAMQPDVASAGGDVNTRSPPTGGSLTLTVALTATLALTLTITQVVTSAPISSNGSLFPTPPWRRRWPIG